MSAGPAHVIVVDDDLGIREALDGLLRSVGLKVSLHGSVADFLGAALPGGPAAWSWMCDCRGRSGLDLQAELASAGVGPPIIFITGHGDIPMSVGAMKAGAVEFLPKPFRDQDLLDAIQVALERDRAQVTGEAVEAALRARLETLTVRERQVFALVATGLLNKQIADEIGVAEITVKVHRGQAMKKMGARSIVDLVRMADGLGLTAKPASWRVGVYTKV